MDGTTSPYAPPAQGVTAARPAGSARPPRPWVAGLLSLFARGAGQAYAGRPLRGLAWALTLWATPLSFVVVARSLRGVTFVAAMGALAFVLFVLHALAVLDAVRLAGRPDARRSPGWLWVTLAVAMFIGLPLASAMTRHVAMEAFKIPSGSMIPTLLVGDHILVDKARAVAGRGDVVVFPFPERPSQDFVKRILATGGDRIEFEDSHPILNGVRVPSCFVGPWQYREDGEEHDGDLFLESVGGHLYVAYYDRGSLPYGHQGPWTVPTGEAFVVGDNRNNAFDSRTWRGGLGGGVRTETVRGVASMIYMATGETGGLTRAGLPLDVPLLPQSAASLTAALESCKTTLAARVKAGP